MNLSFSKNIVYAAFASVSMVLASAPSMAADFGGDCCADLEERVAVLEATTVRKGNRKVSLTVSGHVNQALLVWDDGDESDAYVVTNGNDLSLINFAGDAKISSGWSAGYVVEIEIISAGSDSVSQDSDDGESEVALSEVHMFIESEQLGKVTWGFAGQPTDGTPEVDLSGTENAGYSAIADVAGGFQFRLSNGALSGVTIGNVFDNFNGDTFNIIRYDTPTFAGFTLSASWGEDDQWDVALNYAKALGSFEVAAAIGYRENSDNDGANPLDQDTLTGSISVLHTPTGLNLTFAAGERQFNNSTRSDADFYYIKGGIFQKYSTLGKTAIYGEYGQYNDAFVTDDAGTLTAVPAAITGSEAKVYGFGLVQYIDAAAMQLYIAYRHHEVDFDAVDMANNAVAVNGIEDFDTVLMGGRIEF